MILTCREALGKLGSRRYARKAVSPGQLHPIGPAKSSHRYWISKSADEVARWLPKFLHSVRQ